MMNDGEGETGLQVEEQDCGAHEHNERKQIFNTVAKSFYHSKTETGSFLFSSPPLFCLSVPLSISPRLV